tara:strand:- start:4757 stop:9061 length:4305 start_codon:yes stop_codon:yes gene_type:complete
MKRFNRGTVVGGPGPTVTGQRVNLGAFNIGPQARATDQYDKARDIGLTIAGLAGKQMRADQALQHDIVNSKVELAYRTSMAKQMTENPDNHEQWDTNARKVAKDIAEEGLGSGTTLTNILLDPFGNADEERTKRTETLLNGLSGSMQSKIQEGRIRSSFRRYGNTAKSNEVALIKELAELPNYDNIAPGPDREIARNSHEKAVSAIADHHIKEMQERFSTLDKTFISGENKRKLKNDDALKVFGAISDHLIDRFPAQVQRTASYIDDLYRDNPEFTNNLNKAAREQAIDAAQSRRERIDRFRLENNKDSQSEMTIQLKNLGDALDQAQGFEAKKKALSSIRSHISVMRDAKVTSATGQQSLLFRNTEGLDFALRKSVLQVFGPMANEFTAKLRDLAVDQGADPLDLSKRDNAGKLLEEFMLTEDVSSMIAVLTELAPRVMSDMFLGWNRIVSSEKSDSASIKFKNRQSSDISEVINSVRSLGENFSLKAGEWSKEFKQDGDREAVTRKMEEWHGTIYAANVRASIEKLSRTHTKADAFRIAMSEHDKLKVESKNILVTLGLTQPTLALDRGRIRNRLQEANEDKFNKLGFDLAQNPFADVGHAAAVLSEGSRSTPLDFGSINGDAAPVQNTMGGIIMQALSLAQQAGAKEAERIRADRLAKAKAEDGKNLKAHMDHASSMIENGESPGDIHKNIILANLERQYRNGSISSEDHAIGSEFVSTAFSASESLTLVRDATRNFVINGQPVDLDSILAARLSATALSESLTTDPKDLPESFWFTYVGAFTQDNVNDIETLNNSLAESMVKSQARIRKIGGGDKFLNAFKARLESDIETMGFMINGSRGVGDFTSDQVDKIYDFSGWDQIEEGQKNTNFERALVEPDSNLRKSLNHFTNNISPAFTKLSGELKKIVTHKNLRGGGAKAVEDIIESMKFAVQVGEDFLSQNVPNDFLIIARASWMHSTNQDATGKDRHGFARRLVEGMQNQELHQKFKNADLNQSLDNSLYAAAVNPDGMTDSQLREKVHARLNMVGGLFGSKKPAMTASWAGGIKFEMETISGQSLVVDQVMNRLRYFDRPPRKDGVEEDLDDVLDKGIDLISASLDSRGFLGLSIVGTPVGKPFSLKTPLTPDLDAVFTSKFHWRRFAPEDQLSQSSKGLCKFISEELKNGSANAQQECLGNIANGIVALNFMDQAGQRFKSGADGTRHMSVEWLKTQLPASTINQIFNTVGMNGNEAFLHEANQIIEKYWTDEDGNTPAFWNLKETLDLPRGFGKGKGSSILDVIPKESERSIMNPFLGADVGGPALRPHLNDYGWKATSGQMPVKDIYGSIMYHATFSTIRTDVPFGSDLVGRSKEIASDVLERGVAEGLNLRTRVESIPFEMNLRMPTGKDAAVVGTNFSHRLKDSFDKGSNNNKNIRASRALAYSTPDPFGAPE